MTDYISREAAIKAICVAKCGTHHFLCNPKCDTVAALEAVPAADVVEVVHGRWVHNETYELANGDLVGEAYCTNCELYSSQISTPDGKVSYSVCPRCGAKMDGGADNG